LVDFEEFLNTEIHYNIEYKDNEYSKPEIALEKDNAPDKVEE